MYAIRIHKISFVLMGLGAFAFFASPVHGSVSIQSTPVSGLKAYWTFDNTTINWGGNIVKDMSGNGNTGTLVLMSQSANQTSGKIGQGIFIDGSVNSISLASNPLTSLSNANSVCAWVKSNDISVFPAGWNQTFMNLYTDSNNAVRVGSVVTSGSLFVSYRSGGSYYSAQSSAPVFVNNTWEHVCYVWNGAGLALYANGVSVATTTNPDTIGLVNTIGARNDIGDGTWYGSIDDLRIYDRALSATDVQRIYHNGALIVAVRSGARYAIATTPSGLLTDGLAGHWTLDGNKTNWASNTTQDSSGNGNSGTLTNMSTTSSPVMGKIGQGLSFDGVDDSITFGNPSSLNFGSGSFSYGMWVYVDRNIGSWDTPWYKAGASAAYNGYDIELGSGDWTANIADGTTVKSLTFTATPVVGAWKHLMVVVDRSSNTMTGYLDGVPGTPVDITGFGSVSGSTDAVLSRSDYPFAGKIDDVRVYNKALTTFDVRQLYNQGR